MVRENENTKGKFEKRRELRCLIFKNVSCFIMILVECSFYHDVMELFLLRISIPLISCTN